MSSDPSWIRLPAAVEAAAAGRYGVMLRLARTAAGLTLDAAGRRVGYSASTLSRLERGVRPLTDITVLRSLSAAFDIPPRLFGLTETTGVVTKRQAGATASLPPGATQESGDDPVQRRQLLTGLAGLAATPLLNATPAVASAADPARRLITGLEQVLLHGRPPNPGVASVDLQSGLVRARADFQAGRYSALADRLPWLLGVVDDETPPATAAELYNTAVHVCIKIRAAGLDWLAADRAMTAARRASDPMVEASVLRNVSTLLRNAGQYQNAQCLALRAADQLPLSDPSNQATYLSMYGALVCTAGYAAAQAGDRSRCAELLGIAADAADRLGGDRNERWVPFGPGAVALYWVSAAWRLGDAGAAIDHARRVHPDALRLPERQARYWVDVARAYQQWGKPAECYRALRIAAAVAPEEVRAQPKVRALAGQLLAAPTHPGMSGIRQFAARLGAP